jgi:hypothetical protein
MGPIMRIIRTVLLALVLCLALATTAFAQSTLGGYNDEAGQVQAQVGGGGGTPPASAADVGGSGSLPFTGLDVALIAGAGGLLAAAGLGMRRLTRSTGSA